METNKARERRLQAGWFDKYITGKVIDIGVGRFESPGGADPVTPDCEMHDRHICDAHEMAVYEDFSFDCVHASHILEHMERPTEALQNWFRILKPGGYLIISVPERDSYERKLDLPGKWNADHKTMWIYAGVGNSWTFNLSEFCQKALPKAKIVEYHLAVSCSNLDRLHEHGDGEYSIEIILKK